MSDMQKGILAGTVSVFIWALIPSLVKFGVAGDNLNGFLFSRFLLSSLVLALPLYASIRKLRRSNILPVFLYCLLAMIHFYYQAFALTEVSVGWYIVFFSLAPVFSLILVKGKLSRKLLLALSFGVLGAIAYAFGHYEISHIGYTELASLLWSFMSWIGVCVLVTRIQNSFTDLEIASLGNFSMFFFALFFLNFDIGSALSGDVVYWLVIASLALFAPLSFFLFSYSLRHFLSFGLVAQYLEIVFGLSLAWILFNEHITVLSLIGVIMILLSVFFSMKGEG
jgi:drug/metabolite transporter (DMT)-like permease